jgi:hypothetical protein
MFIKEQRINANEIYVLGMNDIAHHWTKDEIFTLIQNQGSVETAIAVMKEELSECCAGMDYITIDIDTDGTPIELSFRAPTGEDE